MSAGKYDIIADQGSEFKLKLVIKNPDKSTKDFTGYTAKAQIRKKPSATKVDGEFEITFTNPRSSGEIVMTLPAEVSSAIKVGDSVDDDKSQYVYDLEVYAPVTLKPLRLIDGTIRFSPEVTKQ